jgi:transposase
MKRSYTFAEKQHVLSALKRLEEDPATSHLTSARRIQLAAGADHPPSRAAIYRWKSEALTEAQHNARLQRRGRSSKLTDEQKQLMCGFACYLRHSQETVSLQRLRDFSSAHLGETLANSTISDLMHSWGFSSQRAMKRESRLTTQKVVDDAIDLLTTVRSFGYSLDCIIVMDETGLWSNVVAPNTYHFRNGYTIAISL